VWRIAISRLAGGDAVENEHGEAIPVAEELMAMDCPESEERV